MSDYLAPFITILALIIRHALTVVGGGILAESMTDPAMSDLSMQLAGVLVTGIGVVWSIYEKKSSGKLQKTSRNYQ